MENKKLREFNEETIDFYDLERELHNAMEADQLYWQQNDAKFRAVNQKVSNYDEFKDIVSAAHLRPLDKKDKMQNRPKTVWNSLAVTNNHHNPISNASSTNHARRKPDNLERLDNATSDSIEKYKMPSNSSEFGHLWQKLSALKSSEAMRWDLLKQIADAGCLKQVFVSEMGFGLLGEIMQVLLFGCREAMLHDIKTAVRVLEAAANTKRFSLTLQFLGANEKCDCKALFSVLQHSLQIHMQDLSDFGVTEWSIQELSKKYDISLNF